MIAAKYTQYDITNTFWPYISQEMFCIWELNQMEHEMCRHLDWLLDIDPNDLCAFKTMIQGAFGSTSPTCPAIRPTSPLPTMVPRKQSNYYTLAPAMMPPSPLHSDLTLPVSPANPYPSLVPSPPLPLPSPLHSSSMLLRSLGRSCTAPSMGCEGQHEAFALPVTCLLPVSTTRPSLPYHPAPLITAHPGSPHSMHNNTSNHSPLSSFARRGLEKPLDKMPLSLKHGMDDEGPRLLKKCVRIEGLHQVPMVFPPLPSTDAHSSAGVGLGHPRFDPVCSCAADTWIETNSPKRSPTLPVSTTHPSPPYHLASLIATHPGLPHSMHNSTLNCSSLSSFARCRLEPEMSMPAPHAPISQATPQHPTFKVTLRDNAVLPPPVSGTTSTNHHHSQSGSNGPAHGSACSHATPSPTMAPLHQDIDEDYDEGVADALMRLSGLKSNMRSHTASIHSVSSPGSHGLPSMAREGQHNAFAPPVTHSPPVSTTRPSLPYRPASSILAHPGLPQSMHNRTSNHSPPSSFARCRSEQPLNKMPSSLKCGMDDEGPRLDQVPMVFPPLPLTDVRSSASVGLGRPRFDP
ncbi:hypothetical protein FRC11_013650, partial [Ceratobasidium sp. 423]